jgi:hypothetical protein
VAAFITDLFSRRIVGSQVADTLRAKFALDTLEMAIWSCGIKIGDQLVHHSDRGLPPSQLPGEQHLQRLGEARLPAAVAADDDGQLAPSTSSCGTVEQDPTTTSVTCPPGTVVVAQATTATVTDTAIPGQATTPGGTVAFSSGTSGGTFSPAASCTLSATATTAQASCPVTYTPAQVGTGTQTITASYSGDVENTASTGTVTVTVQPTPATLAYTGPQSIAAGTGLVPTASLSSSVAACEASQPVSFTLNANPATGAAGTYPLESATTSSTGIATGASISTSRWQAGAYTITASYAGTANCAPSTATAALAVTTAGLAAAGAGSYPVTGAGTVSFGFIIAKIPHTSAYLGSVSLVSPRKWQLTGTLSGFLMTSATQGQVTGTGNLYWWNPLLSNAHGGWQLAKSGVSFTASFSATTKTASGAFGIQISYTPVSPQPTPLPNSAPVNLTSGAIAVA